MNILPKFITFEGIDASGKSTAFNSLVKYIQKKFSNSKFVFTHEPGGDKIADEIRNVILKTKNSNMKNVTEALLYAAARRQHLESKIWPAIKEGKIVFCDRYIDSSIAYQGYARGLGMDYVTEINMIATNSTWPDLTIFFDIKPKNTENRILNKKNPDRLEIEGIKFQEKAYEGYMKVIKKYPKRFILLDAGKSKNDVLNQLINIVESFI